MNCVMSNRSSLRYLKIISFLKSTDRLAFIRILTRLVKLKIVVHT